MLALEAWEGKLMQGQGNSRDKSILVRRLGTCMQCTCQPVTFTSVPT